LHEGQQSACDPSLDLWEFEGFHLFFELIRWPRSSRRRLHILGQVFERLTVVRGYVGFIVLPVEEIENLLLLHGIGGVGLEQPRVHVSVTCAAGHFDTGDLLDEVQEGRGDLVSLLVGLPEHFENEAVGHAAQQILNNRVVGLYRTLLVGGIEELLSDARLQFLEEGAQIPQVRDAIGHAALGVRVLGEMFLHGLLVTLEGHLGVEAVVVQVGSDDARRVIVRTSQGDPLLRVCECAQNEMGHEAAPERIVVIGLFSTGAPLDFLFVRMEELAVVDALHPDVTDVLVDQGRLDSPLSNGSFPGLLRSPPGKQRVLPRTDRAGSEPPPDRDP